jgi:hypothetical protein
MAAISFRFGPGCIDSAVVAGCCGSCGGKIFKKVVFVRFRFIIVEIFIVAIVGVRIVVEIFYFIVIVSVFFGFLVLNGVQTRCRRRS